ncbi:MAG: transposase [Erysipelotrichaceae bacterium]|nr:transposase [Erysipelotrichaceae bacterium]
MKPGVSDKLSNGPTESFNRKPKDLKRLARRCDNFEFFRSRIMSSEQNRIPILDEPKMYKDIQPISKDIRGSYNKPKKKYKR